MLLAGVKKEPNSLNKRDNLQASGLAFPATAQLNSCCTSKSHGSHCQLPIPAKTLVPNMGVHCVSFSLLTLTLMQSTEDGRQAY